MKFFYIGKKGKKSWRKNQLKKACDAKKNSFIFLDPSTLSHVSLVPFDSKSVVYFGGIQIHPTLRHIFYSALLDSSGYVLNANRWRNPIIANKYFQQFYFQKQTDSPAIPSFIVSKKDDLSSLIKKKKLLYPFIAKKLISSTGKDVFLVRSEKDLPPFYDHPQKYIFQPFIPNTCDFRVFIVGKKVLGIIRRERVKPEEFRNNISQGGKATALTMDDRCFSKLSRLALEVIKIFKLDIGGVDIILNNETNTLHFMEINSIPDWEGFQKATKVNVAQEIIQYCEQKQK